MPTGYTAKLCEKGQAFREFTLTCARAFGALVMMRDENLDAPIPVAFPPSDYQEKALAEYKEKLSRLAAMTPVEAVIEGERLRGESVANHAKWLAEKQAEAGRLLAMKAEVEKWTPPTSEHEGLKKFMLEQIETSGTSTEWEEMRLAEAREKSPADYYADAIAEAGRMVATYQQECRTEIERANGRTEWVNQLRASLP